MPEPLFLCDDQLLLCMKNLCAENQYNQPRIGADVGRLLSCDTSAGISAACQAILTLPRERLPVLLLPGILQALSYTAMLPEPDYLMDTYQSLLNEPISRLTDRLSCAVNRLLSVSCSAGLERQCQRLIHLRRGILKAVHELTSGVSEGSLLIGHVIRKAVEPLREILPALGYRLNLHIAPVNTSIPAQSNRCMLLTILLSLYNLLLVSTDGEVTLVCTENTLTISTSCTPQEMNDETINELSVVSALSELANWPLNQLYTDGRLSITFKLPVQPAALLLSADSIPLESTFVRRLFVTLPMRKGTRLYDLASRDR